MSFAFIFHPKSELLVYANIDAPSSFQSSRIISNLTECILIRIEDPTSINDSIRDVYKVELLLKILVYLLNYTKCVYKSTLATS